MAAVPRRPAAAPLAGAEIRARHREPRGLPRARPRLLRSRDQARTREAGCPRSPRGPLEHGPGSPIGPRRRRRPGSPGSPRAEFRAHRLRLRRRHGPPRGAEARRPETKHLPRPVAPVAGQPGQDREGPATGGPPHEGPLRILGPQQRLHPRPRRTHRGPQNRRERRRPPRHRQAHRTARRARVPRHRQPHRMGPPRKRRLQRTPHRARGTQGGTQAPRTRTQRPRIHHDCLTK
mmetsp:Transcript_9560/g.31222  ORF Transcript_9560/g.31222 Transcript_9560/m.31222 type:complete len:234 (-) Transcript_9560:164-865(-)